MDEDEDELVDTNREVEDAAPPPPPPPPARSAAASAPAPVAAELPFDADFVRGLLAEHSNRMAAIMDRGIAEVSSHLKTSFDQGLSTTLGKLDQSYQRRFAHIEKDTQAIGSQIADIHAAAAVQAARTAKLEEAIFRAPTPRPMGAILADDDFTRDIDECVVRIRTATQVSCEEIKHALASSLADMGIAAEELKISSSTFGKNFEVTFAGSDIVQAARCRKLFSVQRLPDKTYRRLEATDTSNNQISIYIEPDKNKQTIKSEVITRKIKKALETATGDKYTVRKADHTVFCGPLPVARVRNVSTTDFKVDWNREWTEQNTRPVDTGSIVSNLEAFFADSAGRASWG